MRSRQLIAAHAHGTLTTSGGGFVYSHTSGARLHGLYVDDLVHVTQQTCPSRVSHGKDVVAHTRTLGPKTSLSWTVYPALRWSGL